MTFCDFPLDEFYENGSFSASGNSEKERGGTFFAVAEFCDAIKSRLLFFGKNNAFRIYTADTFLIWSAESFLLKKFEDAFFLKGLDNGFSCGGEIADFLDAGRARFRKEFNNFLLLGGRFF